MTKIIGLTGGIGSGKTTIANYFLAAGIPLYIADDEAKRIMQSKPVIEAIKKAFGNSIFENDILNREKLAAIVFSDSQKLELLNSIVHPAVRKHFDNWVLHHKKYPFIIYEAAILFESGSYKKCDWIITVTAPIESRIQRVMQRDHATREDVITRMNSQWNDAQRLPLSDFIIENNTLESSKLEVDKILKILKIQ